ncbi:MAG: Type 1 glutamine amidotransferase-like domain-containing protein [Euzebya sp.]
MAGPLALVGSGEFLPTMDATDRQMLQGRTPTVAVIPTAAAPEGEASLRRWFDLAHRHYFSMGAEVVEVDVRTRADAEDPDVARLVQRVGLIYLSGGNPGFLAATLTDSVLGKAIATAWRSGTALAGCSAGAMALGSVTVNRRGGAQVAMGLAGPVVIIPHFDSLGFARRFVGALVSVRTEGTLIGVDEDTALVWTPKRQAWLVRGRSAVWLLGPNGAKEQRYIAADEVPLPAPIQNAVT